MRARLSSGDDIIPDETMVHTDRQDEIALVPIDELDVSARPDQACEHTFWFDDKRLYALEPDPETGYWTACPGCGLLLGQKNLGEIPPELRTL